MSEAAVDEKQMALLKKQAKKLDVELVGAEAVNDTSYLTEEQLRDADIRANVDAMEAFNGRVAWFGKDERWMGLGVWRGGVVVGLDTEGQYELIGASIGDALCALVDEEEEPKRRKQLIQMGFKCSSTREEAEQALEGMESPNDVRNALYEEFKAKGTKKAKTKPKNK